MDRFLIFINTLEKCIYNLEDFIYNEYGDEIWGKEFALLKLFHLLSFW